MGEDGGQAAGLGAAATAAGTGPSASSRCSTLSSVEGSDCIWAPGSGGSKMRSDSSSARPTSASSAASTARGSHCARTRATRARETIPRASSRAAWEMAEEPEDAAAAAPPPNQPLVMEDRGDGVGDDGGPAWRRSAVADASV